MSLIFTHFKWLISAALILAVLLFTPACTGGAAPFEYSFFAADTHITLKIYGSDDPLLYCEEVKAQTAVLEKALSRADTASELAKINALPAGEYMVSDALADVVSASLEAANASAGLYDPTIAPLSELWNIGHGGETVPTQAAIDEAKSKIGYKNIGLSENKLTKLTDYASLDLGGSGKGYMLGKAIELLKSKGGYGIASFGGNIGVYGEKPDRSKWIIAIKNPRDANAMIGYVSVESGFVSVSGDYERFFIADNKRYCHIIDPFTGWPADSGVMSVAVWSEDAMAGDIISTALFIMGEEQGLQYCNQKEIAAVFVTAEGVVMCSAAMEAIYTDGAR